MITAKDIKDQPPELCPGCQAGGACDLLSRKQEYEEIFRREMATYDNLKSLPNTDQAEIKAKVRKAALERSEFIAQLRDQSYIKHCPYGKEL